MILLELEVEGVRNRPLTLFSGRARRALGLQKDVTICVTSDEQLRELNHRHRGKNKPTDVLSFPSAFPEFGGDIAISIDTATANAARLGHSTETELKILILHGLLHLAGYDHETDNGEMQAREAELRSKLKLPVALIERAQAAGKAPSHKGSRR